MVECRRDLRIRRVLEESNVRVRNIKGSKHLKVKLKGISTSVGYIRLLVFSLAYLLFWLLALVRGFRSLRRALTLPFAVGAQIKAGINIE